MQSVNVCRERDESDITTCKPLSSSVFPFLADTAAANTITKPGINCPKFRILLSVSSLYYGKVADKFEQRTPFQVNVIM